MATFNEKKFLSQAGVGTLWANVVSKINAANEAQAAALAAEAERAAAAELANANAIAAEAERAAAAELANANAISAEETRAKAAEEANAGLIAGLQATVASILGNEDEINLNSIAELAAWITTHGAEAEAMTGAIEALEAKTVLGTDAEGKEYATVKAYVEAVLAAANSGNSEALTQAVADLTAAIATAKQEAITAAATYTDESCNGVIQHVFAAFESTIEDHEERLGVLEADPITKTEAEALVTGANQYTDAECAKVYDAMVALTTEEINAICGVTAAE